MHLVLDPYYQKLSFFLLNVNTRTQAFYTSTLGFLLLMSNAIKKFKVWIKTPTSSICSLQCSLFIWTQLTFLCKQIKNQKVTKDICIYSIMTVKVNACAVSKESLKIFGLLFYNCISWLSLRWSSLEKRREFLSLVQCYNIFFVKSLNPGVISKVGWVWSSGWT